MAVPVRVSSSDAVRKPIPLTARAAAEIGNRMMGQPYGWGGYLFNRDCSLAMRDLFVPFGVWLPTQLIGAGQGMAVHQLREGVPLG